jgi:hypothetical protein
MKFKIATFISLLIITTNLFAAGFLPIANVIKVKGKALINKEQIKVGSEIVSGVEISIPKTSDYVEVKFQNGHIVRFTGAEVAVGEFTPKAAHFDLSKGKISTTIKALTPDETFIIKTSSATFNIHEGKNTLIQSKLQTHLEVAEGSVTVKTAQGEREVKKSEKVDFKN